MILKKKKKQEKNVIKLNERFIFRKILTQNVLCKKKEENEKSCERLCDIQIHSKKEAYQTTQINAKQYILKTPKKIT